MNTREAQRCQSQLQKMGTKELKELVEMLETANQTECETLVIALEELKRRSVNIDNLQLIDRADKPERL